jgi:hypothetical protein
MAFVFTPEETSTPDGLKRRRRYAEALMAQGTDASPVKHWTQALARVLQSGMGGYLAGKADREEKENAAADSGLRAKMLAEVLGGSATTSSPASSPAPAAPSMAGEGAARSMSMPSVTPEMKEGIVKTASALGISPVDLATTISYETGGTFDPTKAGPRTQWGQHRGLIQFGEPQAKQHGVDWTNPVASQLGENGAVASYLRTAGVKPGMGLLDIYSAINAGAPGLYNRSDAGNGGAPGTVRDKVEKQMAGHRAKAQALFADLPAPGAGPVASETGEPGFVVPPGEPAMDQRQFNAIHGNEIVQPAFQSEGIGQPWMGTALQPDGPQVASAPLPPPRPADLAMRQADVPAQGAVPAIGQMPPAPPPEDLSNAPGAGARELLVQALQGGQGAAPAPTPAPQPATPPAAAPAPAQGTSAAAAAANIPNSALIEALTNPRASAATQQLAASLLSQRVKPRDQWLEQKLPDGSLAQRNSQTGELRVVRPGVDPAERESKQLDIETKRKNLGKVDAPTVQRIKQPDGSEVAVQWDQEKKAFVPLQAPEGGNAVKAPGKLTEQQSKDVGFYNRGSKIIDRLEKQDEALKDVFSKVGGSMSNYLKTDAYRQAEQTGRELLAVILRKDTGAAVTDKEMELYSSIYLPGPADDPQTVAQKRAARRTAIEGLKMGLGPAEILFNSQNTPAPAAAPANPAQRPTGQTKSGVKWSVE